MSLFSPKVSYIPPEPLPPEPPPVQQPQGTPDQYSYLRKGAPSFMASAAPAPAQTATRTLIGGT